MFKYIDYSRPPFLEISLPPAIIIHAIPLILLYAVVLGVEVYILSNEQHFKKYISSKHLRLAMATLHITIPMIFITGNPPFDLLFAAVPWFLASYTAYVATDQLSFIQWVQAMLKVVTITDDESSTDKRKIRLKGLSKLFMGIFKIAVMHLVVNPLLPRRPEYALDYPWFSVESLVYTALFGIKAYLLLGLLQIYMSLCQVVLGITVVELFDSPIISSSPRDFWSRRWNKVVRNLLHQQVFTNRETQNNNASNNSAAPKKPMTLVAPALKKTSVKKRSTKKTVTTTTTTTVTKRVTRSSAKASADLPADAHDDTNVYVADTPAFVAESDTSVNNDVTENQEEITSKKSQSFWSTKQGRGLLSFIISGLFHELIIMSVCRKLTLENFVFFTLHGLAVGLEVLLRQGNLKQEPQGATRLFCIAAQFLFMSVTGRLFTGPFLRYNFFGAD